MPTVAGTPCACPRHLEGRSQLYDLHLYKWPSEDDDGSVESSPSPCKNFRESAFLHHRSSSAAGHWVSGTPQACRCGIDDCCCCCVVAQEVCQVHGHGATSSRDSGETEVREFPSAESKVQAEELQDLHLYTWPTDDEDDGAAVGDALMGDVPLIDIPPVKKSTSLPMDRKFPSSVTPSPVTQCPPRPFPTSKSVCEDGLSAGARQGYATGGREGYAAGSRDGYAAGSREGYAAGGREGYAAGSREGYVAGGRQDVFSSSHLSTFHGDVVCVQQCDNSYPLLSFSVPKGTPGAPSGALQQRLGVDPALPLVLPSSEKVGEGEEEGPTSSPSTTSSTPSSCSPFSPGQKEGAPFSVLPDDILLNVFSKIDRPARLLLGLVCRRWHRVEVRLRESLKLDYGSYQLQAPWQGTHQGFLDYTLERLLPQMPILKHLELTNVVQPQETPLTDDGLVLVGTWCKKLQTLRLVVSSPGLSGRGVTAALLGCGRSLLELELQRCPGVDREALKAIAEYCPQLRSLSLRACNQVNDLSLSHLLSARCQQSLQCLNLGQCRHVTDRGLMDVAQSFPALTSLDVSHCDVTDVGVLALPTSCPELKIFAARGCSDLSNVCMKAFAASSVQLQELDIRRVRWITSAGVIAVLKHCLRLKRICADQSITTDEVRRLARVQRVELVVASSQHRTPQLLSWF